MGCRGLILRQIRLIDNAEISFDAASPPNAKLDVIFGGDAAARK